MHNHITEIEYLSLCKIDVTYILIHTITHQTKIGVLQEKDTCITLSLRLSIFLCVEVVDECIDNSLYPSFLDRDDVSQILVHCKKKDTCITLSLRLSIFLCIEVVDECIENSLQ